MNMKIAHSEESPSKAKSTFKNDRLIVRLTPKTPSFAKEVGSEEFEITEFPFRVGRTSMRNEDPMEINDLAIPDSRPFNVSRNHFSIEKNSEGVFVHDRGSYLGTIVNGKVIGGHHKEAWIPLKPGENDLIVGSNQSPFKFLV